MYKFSLPALLITVICILTACNSAQPISDEEAINFAREMEKSVKAQDPAFINNMVDKNELCNRIAAYTGVQLDASMKKEFIAQDSAKMGDMLLNNGYEYELVKHYVKSGRHHLIFRMFSGNKINYQDHELIKHKGKISVADMYLYNIGEHLSEMTGQALNLYSHEHMNADTFATGGALIHQITVEINTEKYASAHETFRWLPKAFKSQKACRFAQIKITAGLHDTAILARQVKAYIADFPQSPDIYLMQLNIGFLHGDYYYALHAIDSLDHFIDKDPYLDYYRGIIYKQMEKQDSAAFYFSRLHQSMPQRQEALIELIYGSLDAGKAENARKYIEEYRRNKNYDQYMLRMIPVSYPQYTAYFN